MKVLILDDEKDVRNVYHFLLEEIWPDVEIQDFRNGDEALAGMATFLPELVITDLQHPGLAGSDFVKSVQQKFPDTVVVVASSVSSEDKISECREAGAKLYLIKPVEPEVFNEVKKVAEGNANN